ncbi:uncharacterized protein LOC144167680 [Haemaphysalis longicornis]
MDEMNPDWAPSLNLGYMSTMIDKKQTGDRYNRCQNRARARSEAEVSRQCHVLGPQDTNVMPVASGSSLGTNGPLYEEEETDRYETGEQSSCQKEPAAQHESMLPVQEQSSCQEEPAAQHEAASRPCCVGPLATQSWANTTGNSSFWELSDNETGMAARDGLEGEEDASDQAARIASLEQENGRLQSEVDTLKKQLAEKNLAEDILKLNEGMGAFYTGLPNYEVLKAVYDLIEPDVHHTSRNCLPKFQEMVVFLIRLRLNLHLEYIAYRYHFSYVHGPFFSSATLLCLLPATFTTGMVII